MLLVSDHRDISRFSHRVAEHFGQYVGEANLNLGCAQNPEPGFVNLDLDQRATAEVFHDLESVPLPFGDSQFDCVLGSHVFEHVRNFLPLVADIHRILKPGGVLIGITPYISSDDAWDSPHHVRAFSENTWHYVCQSLYACADPADPTAYQHAGRGAYQGYEYKPWQVAEIRLSPYPDIAAAAMAAARQGQLASDVLNLWKRQNRNVIKEITCVLRKVSE